ncbi:bifunctional ornithine acetyltransferase/N-acetylglutamate synthase [Enterococcus saccharolyticus]|uniref:Arginine biosynthesis bifunctional protein ArgJ n=1 Tax=Enterococcus saccharolyticus subsp. saccharolyticus ATCC 43076 TaxID=1139996 RepID=S0JIY3_9ENTE|nr:bifunctional ornithine acetyltransferase/N-acetylglutamate synthase [Enterococcus saccharolyticus]EOT28505.1 glutamate N-acetyltransferase/amino-acid acetyltransferase [Enterococcus saccharolyticus subsp. saccharolyticus ATCC 43076]EOT81496.1 glutamate N-acetyltransferase/amino-acid acetyltransferase [Enterococcus saccharolyticus subsp. saccharolyticus ATCC 43076]OJG87187.1 glutamate N-acetyltransferase/amino-acid acetyltransferase [Enterococcus saccharolyticus]
MEKIKGTIASPIGFHADGIHCGLKRKKLDLGWIYSDVPASVAGVFTTNQVQAAPIKQSKEVIQGGKIQGILVNSGNANACTGEEGLANAKQMQVLASEKLGIDASLVAVASTGVIGHQLEMEKIVAGVEMLHQSDAQQPENFQKAILTTDTTEKAVTVTAEIDGKQVTVAGCSKGSGMIHPNMATMLGFVTTDIAISSELLQTLLKELTEVTFNQITVDGDTSTNDMVVVMANGLAKNVEITEKNTAYLAFKEMLRVVLTELAKLIAKDGEGATKLIEVDVTGAQSASDARMIAKSIVGSMLVKSAIFGKDPNWGRILCAIGYSGISFDPTNVTIELAGLPVFKAGEPLEFDAEQMEDNLSEEEIKIGVYLNEGTSFGQAWGCDLTYDYVKINALYNT